MIVQQELQPAAALSQPENGLYTEQVFAIANYVITRQRLIAVSEDGLWLQAEQAAACSAIDAVGDMLADMPDELRSQHGAVWHSMAADIESLGFAIFKLRMHDAASIRLLRRLLAALVPATEGERQCSLPCR